MILPYSVFGPPVHQSDGVNEVGAAYTIDAYNAQRKSSRNSLGADAACAVGD
jgi:hypothetical protein